MNERQLRWFRFSRSGLATPFASPEECAASLAGIQAQILPASALALWNRSSLETWKEFEQLLWEERTILKLWGQRGTLHLYRTEDWPLLTSARRLRRSYWSKRWAKSGGTEEAYEAMLDRIEAVALEHSTFGRSEVREALGEMEGPWLSSWGGVFSDLVRRGKLCHAAASGGEGKFAHRSHWLPEMQWEEPEIDAANVEMARRYLRHYGTASVHDLAYWRGARINDARSWLKELEPEVTKLPGTEQWLLREDVEELQAEAPTAAEWPMKMLYRFDPFLLAHKDKSWLLDMQHYKQVWRKAGHIEGVVMIEGQIQATWRYHRSATKLEIDVWPFGRFSRVARRFVKERSEELAVFFDLPLESVKFH